MFKALVLEQEDGATRAEVRMLDESSLPNEKVQVAIEYSSLNYKDGLAITGAGKIINQFPMVPGIDLAGTVIRSEDDRFQPGQAVVLTGWGVGERYWGGFAERANLNPDWLVPLPSGLSPREAMVIGTAGLTAMLCVMALEDGGVTPTSGPILVTGASGGVGSVAIALLAQLGYEVVAGTGRPEGEEYLKRLGADSIRLRDEMAAPSRPLEKQLWAGVIDTVGDQVLARALAETRYGGVVAACGLAGGVKLPTTVMPFILRNVRLQGVDSVMCPTTQRIRAWERLQQDLPREQLQAVEAEISLEQLPEYAARILRGEVRGRTLVAL
ncbi:MAG: oxidoreductase [Oceanospirillales bacterium]|nr:oxidoreductase [Oceanospirillales bacterium]